MKNSWLFGNILSCMIKNEPFGFTHTDKKGLDLAKNKEAARIKVENSHADIILFTSKDCNMWNTYDGSLEIMDMLRKIIYSHHYDLVVYEDAGEISKKMAPRLVLSMGGTLRGNAHAKEDSWVKTIVFFKK